MLKHIILLLFPIFLFGQSTPKRYTSNVDVILVGGQSNGENFMNSSIYGNSSILWGQRLCDSLEVSEGWAEAVPMLFAQAGKGVHKRADLVDWHPQSVGETMDVFMGFVGSSVNEQGVYFYPSYYNAINKAVRYRVMLWIQGETDAAAIPDSEAHYNNLMKVFTSVRTSLREPNLPIIIIKLNDDIDRGATSLSNVRAAQELAATNDPYTWIVNIDDFDASGADYTSPLNVHYSNVGLQKIFDRVLTLCRTSIF